MAAEPLVKFDFNKPFTILKEKPKEEEEEPKFDFNKPFTIGEPEEKEPTGQEEIYERLRERKESEREAGKKSAEIEREQAAAAAEWYKQVSARDGDKREREHWENQKRFAAFYREIAKDRKAWSDKVTRLSETLPLASEEDRRKEARSLAREEEDALIRKSDEFEKASGLEFRTFGKSLQSLEMKRTWDTAMAKARTALGAPVVSAAPEVSTYDRLIHGPYGQATEIFESPVSETFDWSGDEKLPAYFKRRIKQKGVVGGAFGGLIDIPEIKEEDVKALFPGGGVPRDVAVGVLNAVNGLVESVASPGGVATAGVGVAFKGVPAALRAVHGIFAVDLTRNVLAHNPEMMRILENPDISLQDKTEAVAGQVLLALFAAGAMKGALKGEFKGANVKTPKQAMMVYREVARGKKAEPKPIEKPKVREREVLEKLPDESWPEFYERVGEQQLLLEHQRGTAVAGPSDVATPVAESALRDAPIRPEIPLKEPPPLEEVPLPRDPEMAGDIPLPKDPEMAPDVPLREDFPLPKDPEIAGDVPLRRDVPLPTDVPVEELPTYPRDVSKMPEPGSEAMYFPPEAPKEPSGFPLEAATEALKLREMRGEEVKKLYENAQKKGAALKAARAEKAAAAVKASETEALDIAKRVTGFGEEAGGGDAGRGRGFKSWLAGEDPTAEGGQFRMSMWDRMATKKLTEYRPLTALQRSMERIYKEGKKEFPAEGDFEFLPGSYVKARRKVISFDQRVSKELEESGLRDYFGVYAFFKRTESRLKSGNLNKEQLKRIKEDLDEAKEMTKGEIEYTRKESKGVDGYIKDLKEARSRIKKSGDKQVAATLMDNGEVKYWDTKMVEAGMNELRREINSPEQFKKLEEISDSFQSEAKLLMDMLVKSGLVSKEARIRMEAANDYYTPWLLEKYLKERKVTLEEMGKGRKGFTLHRIQGINHPDFKLHDISETFRQRLADTQVLADYNLAKLEFLKIMEPDLRRPEIGPGGEKVNVGGEGLFIRRLTKDMEPAEGMAEFTVMRDGHMERYSVDPEVAGAINAFGSQNRHWALNALSTASKPFKAGVTKFSAKFQLVNVLASDMTTNAFTARTGLKLNPLDWAQFLVIDYPQAFGRAFMGNLDLARGRVPGQFYLDFMESGLGGNVLKQAIEPSHAAGRKLTRYDRKLEGTKLDKAGQVGDRVLEWADVIPDALEEMGKLVGVKRALKREKVKSKNMVEFFAKNKEWKREIMQYAGSPQFTRFGSWNRNLDPAFAFYNAPIQGIARDLQRITDLNSPEGTKARTRLATAVTLPTASLAIWNMTYNKEDLDKESEKDLANYWHLYRGHYVPAEGTQFQLMDSMAAFDKDKNGFLTKDEIPEEYRKFFKQAAWKIPKRDIVKAFSNLVEAMVYEAFKQDPNYFKGAAKGGKGLVRDLTPVDPTGGLQTVIPSLSPIPKYLFEAGVHDNVKDYWRKRWLIREYGGALPEPSEQVTPSTKAAYVSLAGAFRKIPGMPDTLTSPQRLQHLSRTAFGDLFDQFAPKKRVQGRKYYDSETINYIRDTVFARFVSSNYIMNERQKKETDKLAVKQATAASKARRLAGNFVRENVKDIKADEVKDFRANAGSLWIKSFSEYPNVDPTSEDGEVRSAIKSMLRSGNKLRTHNEKRLLALPARFRAEWILGEVERLWPDEGETPEEQGEIMKEKLRWNASLRTWIIDPATKRGRDTVREMLKITLEDPDLYNVLPETGK